MNIDELIEKYKERMKEINLLISLINVKDINMANHYISLFNLYVEILQDLEQLRKRED